jgi:hypothetical protein
MALAQSGTPSQEILNQIQQITIVSTNALAAATAAENNATEAANTAAEAAAIVQEIYNGNYGNAYQDLIDQIEYLSGVSSSAFAAATSAATAATNTATAAANAAAEAMNKATAAEGAAIALTNAAIEAMNKATAAENTATVAASSAAEAAAIVQEIYNGNYGNVYQDLIERINYLFMMFYRSDSTSIMEYYPL